MLAAARVHGWTYRRVRNGQLQFPRFIWPNLSGQPNASGIPQRVLFFQMRLFAYLPWLSLPLREDGHCLLASPAPRPGLVATPTMDGKIHIVSFNDLVARGLVEWAPPVWKDLQLLVLNVDADDPTAKNYTGMEEACMSVHVVLKSFICGAPGA